MPKLILVDAHGYLHRAYHALPPLSTSKGEPVNAIYGFARMLFKLLREQTPDYLAICFDAPGITFREKIYPEYKATRKEIDENLLLQFPLSRELVQTMKLAALEKEGFEADDLIAALAVKARKEGFEVLVVSSDKDLLQLVNKSVRIYNEPKQTFFDRQKVIEKWGVEPEQLIDVFALMGDASDNIPGVPGIGPKTAVKLIQEHGSVEQLLESPDSLSQKMKQTILQHRDKILLAKQLLRLDGSAPVSVSWEECRLMPFENELLVTFLKRLEFHSLVSDLFSKGVLSTSKETIESFSENYETILTEEQLLKLVKTLQLSNCFAIDVETTGLQFRKSELVGISVSWEKGHAAYIPLRHNYLGVPQQLKPKEVLDALRPVLENEAIKKVGQNIKFDHSFLIMAGVRMKNIYFDTMIASYCIDSSRTSHRLKDLVPEFVGRPMTRLEELVTGAGNKRGRGKELPMDQVEIEKTAPYACSDADCTLQLYEKFSALLKEKQCEKLFYEVEMPLLEVLTDMEMSGIQVDIPHLKKIGEDFSKRIAELEKAAFQLAGMEFNLNSSKQVNVVLFEKLQLPKTRKIKSGYSTNEEVLQFLSGMHELPKLLLEHRELSKLKSTYIDGLLPLVDAKTSRVHTNFNQTVTATGRLSSSDPNLQNIPIRTEHGRAIRRTFVAERGMVFLSTDYSQIDLRVLAHLSGDATLCRAFEKGEDVHRITAGEVFHIRPEKVSEEQRKKAKAINFGIIYGQQAFGLSRQLGISIAEAQELIDHYFLKYRGVQQWIEETLQKARIEGVVKTVLGRTRPLPEINSKNSAMRAFAERTAINTPVQGTAADIIKIAMIRIYKKLHALGEDRQAERQAPNSKPQARMLVQVHDELLFEVPENKLQSTARMVKQEMENAIKLKVPVQADLKTGKNWADLTAYRTQLC